ncbi:MAG: hypothetical protein AABW59_05010 [archaeon]
MDQLEKANEILDKIAKEFEFSFNIRGHIRGRRLSELENAKEFPISHRCHETTIVAADRLKEAGFSPNIIVYTKGLWRQHFDVILGIKGKTYVVDFTDHFTLKEFDPSTRRVKRTIPYERKGNPRLYDFLNTREKIILELRNAYHQVRPRMWRTERNQYKDYAKEHQLNARLKRRLRK